ncbi:MAG: 6-carboxytetrahydropterin synthase [Bdellovibrionota bacterium]
MPIAYLSRRTTFCASHRLHSDSLSASENLKIFGKCNSANGHGHNYELEVTVRGEIDSKSGMIMNLTELKSVIESAILAEVDHKHINLDCPSFRGINPTAENIAFVFWNLLLPKLPKGALYEVRIRETENNVAYFRGE